MLNETFTVASIADCSSVFKEGRLDYLWRETKLGCRVLLLLQEMLRFNITYITSSPTTLDDYERKSAIYELDQPVDIYARPRTLWSPALHNATPIMPILLWRFGFILRSPDRDIHHFYSLPFSPTVWQCLLIMILLASVLFYILNRAEQCLVGENLECYFSHELLIAIGACCQHYLPVNPVELTSRRIAFISFFFFSFLTYTYYTSTLLSDLVHDKDDMDLETLADSTFGHVVLDSVAVIIKGLVEQLQNKNNAISAQHLNFIRKKLTNIRSVNISTGLAEVATGNTALLSDYVSLFEGIKQTTNINLECDIIQVFLFSNVHKYMFTAKNFKYTEEFKISALWAKETGILQRLLPRDAVPPLLQCTGSHFQANIGHIRKPLFILASSYILCVLLMLGERAYFRRYRVWPYVD